MIRPDAPTTESGLLFGLVLFCLLYAVGIVVLDALERDPARRAVYRKLFTVAIVLRLAASIAIYVFGFVSILGDEDASGWIGAASIYQDWTHRGLSLADLPSVWVEAFRHPMSLLGYQYTVATLFFVTDTPARLAAAVMNNFFGAMTVVFAARVGETMFSHWVGTRVGWWACLLPSLIVWSAQTVKEPVVIFLETIALYACVRLRTPRGGAKHLLACALSILFLMTLRFYAAYVTGAVILLTLALPRVGAGRSRAGAAVALAAVLIPVLFLTGALAQQEAALQRYDIAHLQEIRDWTSSHTGSGVQISYDLNTPGGMAASVAIGAAHLLLAPFPWQLNPGSARTLLTLPELVLWWWLVLYGLVPGLKISIRARFSQIQPLLYFVLGMTFLYGMTFSNVGLVFRQRAQLLPWLLIFAMVGLEQRALNAAVRKRFLMARAAATPRRLAAGSIGR